jgi:hypothetical protein
MIPELPEQSSLVAVLRFACFSRPARNFLTDEVLMFTSRTLVLSLAACLLTLDAAAQTTAAGQGPYQPPTVRAEQRVFFHLNAMGQPGSQDLTSTSVFDLYDERGQFDVLRGIDGGGATDVGAWYRIGRHLGVGVGYTASSGNGSAEVTGVVPHPFFFNRPRAFALDVPGLRTRERAVHLQALWHMPITTAWDATLFVGPSFLHARLDQIADVAISEVGAPFNAVNAVPSVASRSGSGTGFNIGVDTTYIFLRDVAFLRAIGGGLTLRYAGGSVDVDQPGGAAQSVDVGGFGIGGGLRLRF